MPTYAQKKYLFAIYKLGCNSENVSSAEVAKIVGVSKASMVKIALIAPVPGWGLCISARIF